MTILIMKKVIPEQKLPIQIREVNGIHVDTVNVSKAHESLVDAKNQKKDHFYIHVHQAYTTLWTSSLPSF